MIAAMETLFVAYIELANFNVEQYKRETSEHIVKITTPCNFLLQTTQCDFLYLYALSTSNIWLLESHTSDKMYIHVDTTETLLFVPVHLI